VIIKEIVTNPDGSFTIVFVEAAALAEIENIPGWATWTGAEANAWIDTNVTDLASAKEVLKKFALMLCAIRDIVAPELIEE